MVRLIQLVDDKIIALNIEIKYIQSKIELVEQAIKIEKNSAYVQIYTKDIERYQLDIQKNITNIDTLYEQISKYIEISNQYN